MAQTRRGYVVVACLGYSRVGAGALVFSKEAEDLLWGIARCLWSFWGAPVDAGLGSRGRAARWRRAPDRCDGRAVRSADERLVFL
jgi:hypothetical protein